MLPDDWNGAYEEVVWHTNRALFLHRPGAAHSVGLFWRDGDGIFAYWYVNLEDPWRRSPVGFDTWDHELDLVVAPDLSSWAWKDEDDFAWLQEVGIITPVEAGAIRAEAHRAIDAIERRASPYCDGWERWIPDPHWTVPELPANWRAVG
jgi:predicted RNA-binding protein associated with RNAse of E/G family